MITLDDGRCRRLDTFTCRMRPDTTRDYPNTTLFRCYARDYEVLLY